MSDAPFADRLGRGGIAGHKHLATSGRASVISQLRRLQMREMTPVAESTIERCEFCRVEIAETHRHVLDTEERRILCACESCFVRSSGEARYRPTGQRIVWLDDLTLVDELWGRFEIPVGLAFFFYSLAADGMIALYPSPLGATESELDLSAWEELRAANPQLARLEADSEALLINRDSRPPQYVIVPIDRCYELVGLLKTKWQGISGGAEAEEAIAGFFQGLRDEAQPV